MNAHRLATLVLVLSVATACATATPPRVDSGDVPVPKGLAYQPDRSATIESATIKAARHVYRARLEPESLASLIRATLEGSGWRHVTGTATAAHGAIQVYQKGNDTLHVRVWEGGLFNWYTYVEFASARIGGNLSAATQ
jgi:hypothetical protein